MLEEYNYTNRFHQRLKMQNETALRIDGLEMGDTGTFQALVRFTTGTVVTQDFHLTVYEPVPTPEIRILSSSNDICNVTLGCVVPAEAAVNVTWKAPAHLEGPDQYLLSPDRTILHLSLNLSALDRVFFCLVSNPVQMKSVSINASSLCAGRGQLGVAAGRWGHVRLLLLPLLLALEISAVILVNLLVREPRADQRTKRTDAN
ncbi:SLAM family member 8-like [Rhinatrema bivittatum]|uniref:SLAM family member 8-like n=1 Tax=Rhinatrema bivittatum TaxID=194408 RepID=UPI001129CB02|nr:SLAM family member 8-like [Rhinatrema bivittatum]